MESSARYYQLVFIWMKDPAIFAQYLELARPIVERYGGALERMLAPRAMFPETAIRPDIVNIVYYDDKVAHARLNEDPEFEKVVGLRSESISMMSVEGVSIGGALTQGALDERRYWVEVARFGPRGRDGYRTYEAEGGPVRARYGYHVERVLSVDSVSGFPFTADLVKVGYFDRKDGLDRLGQDIDHQRIEGRSHPAAIAESIGVVADVHPLFLNSAASNDAPRS